MLIKAKLYEIIIVLDKDFTRPIADNQDIIEIPIFEADKDLLAVNTESAKFIKPAIKFIKLAKFIELESYIPTL